MTAAVLVPSRRSFLAGGASLAALTLAGCATSRRLVIEDQPQFSEYYLQMYGPLPNERFPVPAVDLTKLDPSMFRTQVTDPTGEAPGTIVVNTGERHLYLVLEGGQAIRYGVGIGRDGFTWSGRAKVGRKAEWPTWTPTRNMINREPDRYGPYAGGLPGGPTNPLGPRALYLYKGGRDTLFRLHGTTEPYTIGTNVSSGCIRLMNQDIIDLYNRVPTGTRVVVIN